MTAKNSFTFLTILVWTILVWTSEKSIGQDRLPQSWESDSTLRSVFFLDHDMGWAVGDRGCILKTEDGGRVWKSISSPRDLVWTNVFFINEKVGWITGGYFRGTLDRSVGVMIRTIDGGKTWQNLSKVGMPFVRRLNFEDEQTGWLECDSNSLYPAGLLVTNDGGHHWKTPDGISSVRLKTGLRKRDRSFTGVDAENALIKFDRRGNSQIQKLPIAKPNRLVETIDEHLLCIADGSVFHGKPNQPLVKVQDPKLGLVRINTIEGRGKFLWAVGSPGCVILTSKDNGQTWTSYRTGDIESLKSVYFLNEERGWAVGALGKIIVTKDGGKTWSSQRNPKLQVGVLNLASTENHVNPECISLLGGSFGHRCAVNLVSNDPSRTWSRHIKLAEGLNRIGNSDLDQPAESKDILKKLVSAIRTWRPAVIVMHDADRLLKEKAQMAIEAANNAEYFGETIDVGLRPWKVQKLVVVSDSKDLESSISINQYSAHLGRTVGLQARFARQLLNPKAINRQAADSGKISWATLYTSSQHQDSSQGITTGTRAYSHPSCQLPKDQLQIKNMQQFRSIANWSQSLEQLGRFQVLSPLDEKAWNEQVTASTSGMDSLTQSFFLQDLAQTYTRLKKPVMADHTERLILQKAPDSDVREEALWKMIQRYGSNESNLELNELVGMRMAKSKLQESKVRQASANQPFDPVRPIGSESDVAVSEDLDVTPASLQNASQLIEIFQNQYPDLNADPDYAVEVAWLKQKMGNRTALDRFLDSAALRTLSPLTRRRLTRERQIVSPNRMIDGFLQLQDARHEKIILDGELNEHAWKTAKAFRRGEKIYYACDGENFFIAGELTTKSMIRQGSNRRRIRDESLEGNERLKIFIDFDRDYCSGIELTIDVRGSCNDAIWRDSKTKDFSFDPQWFLKSKTVGSKWIFEAAIPLKELPVRKPNLGSDWSAWVVASKHLAAGEASPETTKEFCNDDKLLVIGIKPIYSPAER